MSIGPPSRSGPERPHTSLTVLLLAVIMPPLFWSGQLLLSSAVSNIMCRQSGARSSADALQSALFAFDAIALLAAIAAGLVAFKCWRAARDESGGDARQALEAGEGRSRFLALWGVLSSLWFLFAIAFNAIASVMVPPCLG